VIVLPAGMVEVFTKYATKLPIEGSRCTWTTPGAGVGAAAKAFTAGLSCFIEWACSDNCRWLEVGVPTGPMPGRLRNFWPQAPGIDNAIKMAKIVVRTIGPLIINNTCRDAQLLRLVSEFSQIAAESLT